LVGNKLYKVQYGITGAKHKKTRKNWTGIQYWRQTKCCLIWQLKKKLQPSYGYSLLISQVSFSLVFLIKLIWYTIFCARHISATKHNDWQTKREVEGNLNVWKIYIVPLSFGLRSTLPLYQHDHSRMAD
jgi:hypothetical protein